jgi:hypothetical protein
MSKFLLLFTIFIIAEIITAFLFAITAQVFYKKIGFDFKSIIKGTIERLFLFVALANNYTQALTLFSALKLGTRLKHTEAGSKEENNYNDYYLVGNLASVAIAIGYVYLFNNIAQIDFLNRLLQ